MYYVHNGRFYEEFDTNREAEIYCGEHDIPCEEIFEEDPEEPDVDECGFDPYEGCYTFDC